jgi:crotonobetainyl-CoA:carnitine CoA-transferase CaiB-like acyl-CoA transferase
LAAFRDLVAQKCIGYTSDELLELLREAEVPCAKCLTREEVLAQAQLSANDSIEIIDHPLLGKLRIVKSPPKFGGKRLPPARPTPGHGEHTDPVLSEMTDSRNDLTQLRADGVIR